MASWSTRRKFMYSTLVIFVLIVAVALPAFYFLYKPPTCSDGIMNGNETGIDCGGSCVRLCQSAFVPPQIVWGGAKFERVMDGVYNVSSLISNPNVDVGALDVPYKISLFDSNGMLIKEQLGKVNIYPHRNSLAFISAVNVDKRIPSKATFEFTDYPVWFKANDNLDDLAITNKNYTEDENASSLEVTLVNKGLLPYKNVQVSVILSDINDNVIGFSKTTVDSISARSGKEVASFTWPISRNNRVKTIEVIPSIVPEPRR